MQCLERQRNATTRDNSPGINQSHNVSMQVIKTPNLLSGSKKLKRMLVVNFANASVIGNILWANYCFCAYNYPCLCPWKDSILFVLFMYWICIRKNMHMHVSMWWFFHQQTQQTPAQRNLGMTVVFIMTPSAHPGELHNYREGFVYLLVLLYAFVWDIVQCSCIGSPLPWLPVYPWCNEITLGTSYHLMFCGFMKEERQVHCGELTLPNTYGDFTSSEGNSCVEIWNQAREACIPYPGFTTEGSGEPNNCLEYAVWECQHGSEIMDMLAACMESIYAVDYILRSFESPMNCSSSHPSVQS